MQTIEGTGSAGPGPEDMQLLRDIRNRLHELAGLCAQAQTKGYNLAFNINPAEGTVDHFVVIRRVQIKIEES